jgi:putative oxidoreductase
MFENYEINLLSAMITLAASAASGGRTAMENGMTDTLAPYGALVLRLGLGAMALAHGLLKILVFTIPGTVGFFESLGYPGFLAYLVIFAEIAGGLALIAGFQVRLAALAMIPVLIGATLAHAGNGWVFSSPNGGWEYPAFWTLALAVQAMLGAGAFALDIPIYSKAARA